MLQVWFWERRGMRTVLSSQSEDPEEGRGHIEEASGKGIIYSGLISTGSIICLVSCDAICAA